MKALSGGISYMLDAVHLRLAQHDIAKLMPRADNEERSRLGDEISQHKARILCAESDYDEELIEAARNLKRIRDKEGTIISKLEVERAQLLTSPALTELVESSNPVNLFDSLDVGRKQAVIRALMTIILLPHPRGI